MIARYEFKTPRRKYKKPTVDQAAIATRLFREADHLLSVHLQGSVPARRLNGCNSCPLAMLFMEGNLARDVDLRHPIAVAKAAVPFIQHIPHHPLSISAS